MIAIIFSKKENPSGCNDRLLPIFCQLLLTDVLWHKCVEKSRKDSQIQQNVNAEEAVFRVHGELSVVFSHGAFDGN